MSGTSVGRLIAFIKSSDSNSGDKPPWTQNILSSTMAATGRQLKQSRKCFPQLYAITSLTLIIKSIYSVDRGAFMVTTQEKKVLWELNLVRKQQAYRFHAEAAAVHVVSQEQVVG